jgi:hypothetical protein
MLALFPPTSNRWSDLVWLLFAIPGLSAAVYFGFFA